MKYQFESDGQTRTSRAHQTIFSSQFLRVDWGRRENHDQMMISIIETIDIQRYRVGGYCALSGDQVWLTSEVLDISFIFKRKIVSLSLSLCLSIRCFPSEKDRTKEFRGPLSLPLQIEMETSSCTVYTIHTKTYNRDGLSK